MKNIKWIFVSLLLILATVSTFEFIQVSTLKKSVTSLTSQLSRAKHELKEAEEQLEEVKEKLGDDFQDRLNNISSTTSTLEDSINALLREINLSDCECDDLWYIQRKAQTVKSDFEDVQSEIDF